MRIEKLTPQHAVQGFRCGHDWLDRYLQRYALQNQAAGAAVTYVALADQEVVGYFALAVGDIARAEAPDRLAKGLARHPIPVMLLARLAVALDWQGRGLGAGLLKDAMLRTTAAADIAGIRALIVHAKDVRAAEFYGHFGFLPSPTDALHLYLLVKDLAAALKA